ncbi:MAG TPA: AzlD domain-containing protein [Chloroflexia bacterium]|nr:AzlD domain-containing protein [Chloroflexia bacterium]
MQISLETFVTILGMAIVTYATRVSGYWLMDRFTLSRRVEAWLSYIPGAVLVALVAPGILTGGPAEIIATLFTALIAIRTGNILPAMVVGVITVWLLRNVAGIA